MWEKVTRGLIAIHPRDVPELIGGLNIQEDGILNRRSFFAHDLIESLVRRPAQVHWFIHIEHDLPVHPGGVSNVDDKDLHASPLQPDQFIARCFIMPMESLPFPRRTRAFP